jgi:hypothetical protein
MERKDKRMHPEDVGAGSSGGKRRKHVLTFQQKVEVLRKIDCSVSVFQLHWEYGVGQSTTYDIKAQKNQILQFAVVNKTVHIFLLFRDAFLPFFLFSNHCAILELGYLKSGKIAYPELGRSWTFWINDLLPYFQYSIFAIFFFSFSNYYLILYSFLHIFTSVFSCLFIFPLP